MQKLLSLIVLIFFITINSCKKDDFIINSGEVIKKEFLLDDFSQLEIDKYFNVYITDDTINKIVFEGGENLLENIETKIQDSRLIINNNNKSYWLKKYDKINIYLSTNSLKKILIKEPSNVYSTNCIKRNSFDIEVRADISTVNLEVDCDKFFLKIYDSTGDFILNGNSKYCFVYFRGSAVVHAKNLFTNSIEITNCSTGDAYINAKNKIIYNIIRNGNIYYSGDAYDIQGDVSSSGKLIKL
ncbi:MAG: DUF2807 domain-containing protein [Bacteroidales bacterium]|nr:DUF2807 domain-containing protein [Bacteroidales bacterium]